MSTPTVYIYSIIGNANLNMLPPFQWVMLKTPTLTDRVLNSLVTPPFPASYPTSALSVPSDHTGFLFPLQKCQTLSLFEAFAHVFPLCLERYPFSTSQVPSA